MKRSNNILLFIAMYFISLLLLIFCYKNTKVDANETILQNYMEYVHSIQFVNQTNKDLRVSCVVEATNDKNEVIYKKIYFNKLLMNDLVIEVPFLDGNVANINAKFITVRYESNVYTIITIINVLLFVLIIINLVKYISEKCKKVN